jgi:CRP/FNR family transcriptional regulator, cyclic AMP receptor protein
MMAYVFPHRVHNPHAGALRPPPRPLPDAAIGGIGTVTPPLLSRPPLLPGLRPVESQRIEQGAWFAGLSASLRGAILAEARVQHVKRGTRLVERGSVATDWVGVASGALGLSTSWRDGRAFTMELLGPGDWYGDIALVDHSPVDLDIVAQAHSTVLLVPLASLQQLMNSQPELRHALLQLDCRRLRHMFRRLEELQTLPLSQRVAIKLQRLLKQFGRPPVMGVVPTQARMIELSLTQGDLAALLCASRQRINGVLRQLQALGVLGGSHGRIEVLLPQKLADVANGKLVLDTAGA